MIIRGNKLITSLVVVIILMGIMSNNVVLADNKIEVVYYGVTSCTNCIQVEKLLDEIEMKYKDDIIVIRKDIGVEETESEFLIETNSRGIQTIVPTILIGDESLQKTEVIIKELENKIQEKKEKGKKIKDKGKENVGEVDIDGIYKSKFKNMSLVVVILASLLDGVNPCAMAMLLFFMTMLIALDDKSKALKAGISYCVAIFITYLLIGLGLLKAVQYFSGMVIVLKGIYVITIIICIYLIIVDIQDYIALRKGKVEDVKNELNKGVRHKIHNIIRKQSNSKYIMITTFIAGIAVALLEFSCTGQVYIPTITFIISQGSMKALTYLIIYNIGFILPTVIATIVIYKTSDLMTASNMLIEKRKYIKLGSITFYILIVIYFINMLLKT